MFKFFKKYRWAFFTLIFLSVITGVLYFYGKAIVKELLQRYIERETAGAYELTYSELKYNLFDKSFSLSDVSFIPSPNAPNVSTLSYKIRVNYMHVKLADIVALYTDKVLHIQGIDVDEPVVELSRRSDASALTTDLGDLYLAISDYLKVLEIDYIDLKSGTFIYENTKQTFKNIDFRISSFRLDSAGAKQKVFYSEEINLRLDRQSFILPDSIHELSFKSFHLSTRDSLIRFDSVKIVPLKTIDDLPFAVNANIPAMTFADIDFVKAYQDRQLVVDSINLLRPVVAVTVSNNNKAGDPKSVLSAIFKNQEIHTFTINEGDFSFKHKEFLLKSEVNLSLLGLSFDSLVSKDWFEEVEADFSNLQVSSPDSSITLNAGQLSFGSAKREISINELNFENLSGDLVKKANLLNVLFKEVDPVLVWRSRKLQSKVLKITAPNIYLNRVKTEVDSTSEGFKMPFLEVFKSDSLEVINGQITSPDWNITNLTYTATDANVDSALSHFDDFAENERLKLNIRLEKEQYLFEGRIHHIASQKQFEIKSLKLTNSANDGLARGEATLHGLTLGELLSNKKISFDSVKLNKPEIRWELAENKNNDLPDIDLGEVHLSQGDVEIKISKKTLSVDSLNIKGTYTGKEDIKISQFDFKNFNFDQLLLSEAFYTASTGNLEFNDFQYRDDTLQLTGKNAVALNWDQSLWWNDNNFHADTLLISQAAIDIKAALFNSKEADRLKTIVDFDKVLVKNSTLIYEKDSLALNVKLNLSLDHFNSSNEPFSDRLILLSEAASLDISDINVRNNTFELTGAEFIYDSKKALAEGQTFKLKIDQNEQFIEAFTIRNPNVFRLIDRNQLQAGHIALTGGKLEFEINQSNSDVYLPWASLKIEEFEILNTDYTINAEQLEHSLALNNTNLVLKGIYSDSLFNHNTFFDNLSFSSFEGEEFTYPIDNERYVLEVKNYSYNHLNKELYLKGVFLNPQLSKSEYNDVLTYQKDWFDVEADSIIGSDFNLHNAIVSKSFNLQSVTVGGVNADIFRDKQLPFDSTQRKALPQEIFKSFNQKIAVDTIYVFGDISYAELPPNNNEIGSIEFNNLQGKIINFATNADTYELPLYLRASGSLMGAGDFTANVTFDMDNPENTFRFKGRVGAMDLTKMNQLLVPVAGVRIKSGFAESAQFTFDGDTDIASGTMGLRYKKLKIIFLNTEEGEKSGFTQNLKTFFANSFVIHKSNPRLLSFREGVIFFKRNKKKAIFNFWAKSILSGAVSSVGINKSKRNLLQFLKEKEDESDE